MTKLLLIAVGGALGAVLRYLVSGWGQGLSPGLFPVGTLIVNVLGCLVFGFVGWIATGPRMVGEELRVFLMVGFLGGFTTFSTYAWETLALARDGQRVGAFANLALSNVLGLAALLVGARVAERMYGV